MKRIVLLGSTGSIGRQTLDIARQHPDRLQVVGLAAGSNADALRSQGAEWPGARLALHAEHPEIPCGMDALLAMATADDVDLVVVAVAGVIGLLPTMRAIEAGKQIALASKEVLVAAGEVVMPLARKHGTVFTPIDSEHSAVFQCVQGAQPGDIDELILTASGGPFRGWTRERLQSVSVEDALNHPTWRMGGKITIDSATLMNKALEVIEAHWLFGLTADQIDVLVHPESMIHSFVEFVDGSVLAQLSPPDMRLPIQYALTYPDRVPGPTKRLNWATLSQFRFEAVDRQTFPAIDLGAEVIRRGGSCGAVVNAANEAAVARFLNREIGFLEIARCVRAVLHAHHYDPNPTLEGLLALDGWARQEVARWTPSPLSR